MCETLALQPQCLFAERHSPTSFFLPSPNHISTRSIAKESKENSKNAVSAHQQQQQQHDLKSGSLDDQYAFLAQSGCVRSYRWFEMRIVPSNSFQIDFTFLLKQTVSVPWPTNLVGRHVCLGLDVYDSRYFLNLRG